MYLYVDMNTMFNSQRDLFMVVHGPCSAGWFWWDVETFSRGHQDCAMMLLTPPTYPHPLKNAEALPVHRYPGADKHRLLSAASMGTSQIALN